jgi:hypothetical protein
MPAFSAPAGLSKKSWNHNDLANGAQPKVGMIRRGLLLQQGICSRIPQELHRDTRTPASRSQNAFLTIE